MKKGTKPAYPTEVGFEGDQMVECLQTGNHSAHYPGISIRLEIAQGLCVQ